MSVTKNDMALRIAEATEINQLQAKEIIQRLLDGITECISTEGRLELRQFGIFEVRKVAPRRARNPKTGEDVLVPERKRVVFKAGKRMEERILNSRPAEPSS